jgi:hypothetical protein
VRAPGPPPLPFEATPVPRLERPTVEALAARRHDGPAVLSGCLEGWPLYRALRDAPDDDARLAHLVSRVGHREVTLSVAPAKDGQFGLDEADLERPNFALDGSGPLRFEEAARRLARDTDEVVYLQAKPVAAQFPELLPELGRLDYLDRLHSFNDGRRLFGRPYWVLWLGSGGQVVNLHYDPGFNFICLLAGRKRVVLFPPTCLPDLYPGAYDRGIADVPASLVRLLRPDLARFPRLRAALPEARVADLAPGEVLYVPPLWWHHVESFGLNIMANSWVDELPWELVVQIVERAALLFSDEDEGARRRASAAARARLAATPAAALEPALEAKLDALELRRLAPGLPPHWGDHVARALDHFAFRLGGDPLAPIPGGFARWVERIRGRMGGRS